MDGKTNGAAICNSNYSLANMISVLLDFEIYRCTFRHFDNTRAGLPGHRPGAVLQPAGPRVQLQRHRHGPFAHRPQRLHLRRRLSPRPRQPLHAAMGQRRPRVAHEAQRPGLQRAGRREPLLQQHQLGEAEVPHVRAEPRPAGRYRQVARAIFPARVPRSISTRFTGRGRRPTARTPIAVRLVDVYGPDVTIKHNLVIEPEADAPFDATHNYVYHLGSGPQPGLGVDNNLVFRTWAEAGLVDTKTFLPSANSPARDAATGRIGYITKDHYNHQRYVGPAADVGPWRRKTLRASETGWRPGFSRNVGKEPPEKGIARKPPERRDSSGRLTFARSKPLLLLLPAARSSPRPWPCRCG